MTARLALIAALFFITAASFYFPGHTYLQSDTQIYVPMMEREFAGPGILAADPVATRPHTNLTFYDEVSIGIRNVTTLGFESNLLALQVLFRVLGVWGLWLIATGLGFSSAEAVCIAALSSLGAAIVGPSVLTIEYEPVPRGFAMGALVLSLGLAMHRRFAWAGAAAGLATIFHAPTTWPIWPTLLASAFSQSWKPVGDRGADPIRDAARAADRVLKPLFILLACCVGAVIAVLLGARNSGAPAIFETLPAWLEQIQRMRSSYNWISEWKWQYFAHYVIMCMVVFVAARAIRAPRWLVMPAVLGAISIPLSWILLEQMKWSLMTQFQPARAVLWITLLAVVLASAAALKSEVWWQKALWLLPVFWIPIRTVAIPDTIGLRETAVALALSSAFAWTRGKKTIQVLAAFVAFAVIPYFAGVQNYRRDLHSPELDQVAEWARANTPADAVFLFADAKRSLEPGIFRARSLRALYVDWKSGGQANYFAAYAREWKTRWDAVGKCEGSVNAADLASLGVGYAVFKDTSTGGELVFRNGHYAVYRLKTDHRP